MYLRFRRFDSKDRTADLSAFVEVYEMIHGRPAPVEKPNGDVRIQVSLVEAVWVDGKPKQKHIVVLGSIREGGDCFEAMRTKMKLLKVDKHLQQKLIRKISEYKKGTAISDRAKSI